MDLFNRILAAGKRMDLLIEGLLLLAELGQQDLELVLVDLGEFAEKTFASLMKGLPEREITAEFEHGHTVWVDSNLIEVALTHMLTNAIQYTQKSESARIAFGHQIDPNGEALFYLKDNGCGFTSELTSKLFVPFQRLEENEELEGLGLGLAVVQKVIERHHGEIWAEGEKGKGATFYFKLRTSPEMIAND